jgi:hypothetical protein
MENGRTGERVKRRKGEDGKGRTVAVAVFSFQFKNPNPQLETWNLKLITLFFSVS